MVGLLYRSDSERRPQLTRNDPEAMSSDEPREPDHIRHLPVPVEQSRFSPVVIIRLVERSGLSAPTAFLVTVTASLFAAMMFSFSSQAGITALVVGAALTGVSWLRDRDMGRFSPHVVSAVLLILLVFALSGFYSS